MSIKKVIEQSGIDEKYVRCFGNHKAKLSCELFDERKALFSGKYAVLSGMTPHRQGIGKTAIGVALVNALQNLGKKPVFTTQQPSVDNLIKHFYTGLGSEKSQIVPKNEILPYLTGDQHKIVFATNLIVTILEDYISKSNFSKIRETNIRRIMEMEDLNLRKIVSGVGNNPHNYLQETGFEKVEEAELMDLLLLAKNPADLINRISEVVVAWTSDQKVFKIKNFKLTEVIANLILEAFLPNLVETDKGVPVLMHGLASGPTSLNFSSVISDLVAQSIFDFVVTETGFGTDTGFEKFADIKCRITGLKPDCCILVITLNSLKYQSGKLDNLNEIELRDKLNKPSMTLVSEGLPNLEKHIENIRSFGLPVLVALNRFPADTGSEIELVRKKALSVGASGFEIVDLAQTAEDNARNLAREVVRISGLHREFKFLYPLELPIDEKINIIATKIYGASSVNYSEKATGKMALFKSLGFDKFLVQVNKTPFSLSEAESVRGRPRNFILNINDIKVKTGARLIIAE